MCLAASFLENFRIYIFAAASNTMDVIHEEARHEEEISLHYLCFAALRSALRLWKQQDGSWNDGRRYGSAARCHADGFP